MPRVTEPHFDKQRSAWYARIGEPGERGVRKKVFAPPTVKTRADAFRWFEAEQRARAPVPVPDNKSVAYIFEAFLHDAEKGVKEGRILTKVYSNWCILLSHAADMVGARPAMSLDPADVKYIGELFQRKTYRDGRQYTALYARKVCRAIIMAFSWASESRNALLPVNKLAKSPMPTVPDSPHRFASRELLAAELWWWLRRRPRHWRKSRHDRSTALLIRCLDRTGARPGELCGLRWVDLKWSAGTAKGGHSYAIATIPPSRWKAGKKTGKPRTIYFTPRLTRALNRLYVSGLAHAEFVFVHGGGRAGVGADTPWESGERLAQAICQGRRGLIKHIESLRGKSELSDGERKLLALDVQDTGPNRITNYLRRHTAISTLYRHRHEGKRLTTAEIAAYFGTSAQMIEKVYGHLDAASMVDVMGGLVGKQ